MAFMCYAQACEGDFTVGQDKLDRVADTVAFNWIHRGLPPSDLEIMATCQNFGFNYSSLLDEEIDYLQAKVEEMIKYYG